MIANDSNGSIMCYDYFGIIIIGEIDLPEIDSCLKPVDDMHTTIRLNGWNINTSEI